MKFVVSFKTQFYYYYSEQIIIILFVYWWYDYKKLNIRLNILSKSCSSLKNLWRLINIKSHKFSIINVFIVHMNHIIS
jgi:hypothetical protein